MSKHCVRAMTVYQIIYGKPINKRNKAFKEFNAVPMLRPFLFRYFRTAIEIQAQCLKLIEILINFINLHYFSRANCKIYTQ